MLQMSHINDAVEHLREIVYSFFIIKISLNLLYQFFVLFSVLSFLPLANFRELKPVLIAYDRYFWWIYQLKKWFIIFFLLQFFVSFGQPDYCGDSLIMIMQYVVRQAQIRNLGAELAFTDCFGSANGVGALSYMLATLLVCCNYRVIIVY